MSDEKFSPAEPGLSHPLTRCAIGLTDDGRLCLMAGDNCGIVLDQETGVITLYGTEIKFASNDISVSGKRIKRSMLEEKPSLAGVGKQLRIIDGIKE